MDSNFPEFMPYLMEKHEEDVGFHVEVCGEELEYPEECLMIIGAGDMIITPVPQVQEKVSKNIGSSCYNCSSSRICTVYQQSSF